MDEYISKQSVLDYLNGYLHSIGEYNLLLDIGQRRALTNAIQDISAIKTSDVQSVVDTENMATVSDEFICKKCGIYLIDYSKVVMAEDNDGYIDEQHYEYEPKFCPECGAKVKDGDAE
jgi:hypothetical protein